MKRAGVLLAVALVASLVAVPGVAAAQETRTGGTVIVEEGEQVDDLTVVGGTVVIDGTVDGDLTVLAGTVTINGEVTGNVNALSGDVQVNGQVGGDVDAASGNVWLEDGGRINGSLSAAAGGATINGTVGEDVQAGAGTVVVGPNAQVGGDLVYAGELRLSPNAQIAGEVTQDSGVFVGPVQFPTALQWAIALYALLINLLLGIILLALAPGFARDVAGRASGSFLGSVGIGLLTLIGVPILLGLLALTVVGVPLTIVGSLLFVLFLWIATVYGRFAVGAWLLGVVGSYNRWIALLLGLILVGALAQIPYVGPLISAFVTLVGIGALTLALRDARRERGARRAAREEPAEAE